MSSAGRLPVQQLKSTASDESTMSNARALESFIPFFSHLFGGVSTSFFLLWIRRINTRASFFSRIHILMDKNRRTDAKRTCTIGDKAHAGHPLSISVFAVELFDISLDGFIVVAAFFGVF